MVGSTVLVLYTHPKTQIPKAFFPEVLKTKERGEMADLSERNKQSSPASSYLISTKSLSASKFAILH